MPPRILVVDPVHPVLGHEQGVGVYLERPQRSPRGGGKEGIARPRGEDNDAALLEVPYRTPTDVGFGDLLDVDGGLDPGRYSASFEGRLQSHRVYDGAKHRHVVGRGPLYAELVGDVRTAEDVAAAYDDGQLCARLHSLQNALRGRVEAVRVDPVAPIAGEALPGELQYDAPYRTELRGPGLIVLGLEFGGVLQGRPRARSGRSAGSRCSRRPSGSSPAGDLRPSCPSP